MKLFIELDSLIDTRIGLIRHMWPEKASLINMNHYVSRVREDMYIDLGISKDEWDSAWKARGLDAMSHSIYTALYHNIPVVIGGTIYQAINNPMTTTFSIIVNTFPYQLTKYESDCVCDAIKEQLWADVEVVAMYVPIGEVTTTFLKAHSIGMYVVYNYQEWVIATLQSTTENIMPDLKVYYPKLMHCINDQELSYMSREKLDIFRIHAQEFSPLYSAEAVDIKSMSMIYDMKDYS